MTETASTKSPVRWKCSVPDRNLAALAAAAHSISPITAGILEVRGYRDDKAVTAFLEPRLSNLNDPFLFKDMDRAAARVADAIESGEKICIYGDYDADGMTSAALLKLFLQEIGLAAATFLPDREADGYGLNTDRLGDIAASGTSLVICVDCGIKSIEAAKFSADAGMDLVILDHHQPGPVLPDVCAVVDPHRHDCPFPFKDLAAVGISFYFCGALRRTLVERGRFPSPGPDIRNLLDLVALGTVADVMPLIHDNRVMVRAGLDRINSSPRPGIAALKSVAEIRGPVTSGNISFKMAPRLNASGRMSHPDTSLSLLTATNDGEAARWAQMLDRDNSLRREVGGQVLEEARALVQKDLTPEARAIVVAGEGWHAGVLGIAAARLVEEYFVPSIVLSIDDGVATGSGRSVEGFDLGAALASLDHMLLRNGGHPMAAGLSLTMDRFDEFKSEFSRLAGETLCHTVPARTLDIDIEVAFKDLDRGLAEEIATMEPFGMENTEPVLMTRGVRVVSARRVGRDGSHLKLQLSNDGAVMDGIWFGAADSEIGEGDFIDAAFCLSLDPQWQNLSLRIRDIRPAEN